MCALGVCGSSPATGHPSLSVDGEKQGPPGARGAWCLHTRTEGGPVRGQRVAGGPGSARGTRVWPGAQRLLGGWMGPELRKRFGNVDGCEEGGVRGCRRGVGAATVSGSRPGPQGPGHL